MRKLLTMTLGALFVVAMPVWAQRGRGLAGIGGGAQISAMSQSRAAIRPGPVMPDVEARSSTRSNASARMRARDRKMEARARMRRRERAEASRKMKARPEASARSNAGGTTRGLERAESAQSMNTRADANGRTTVSPGVEKAETHVGLKTRIAERLHLRKSSH